MSYKRNLAPVGIAGPLTFNAWGDVSVTIQLPMHSGDYRTDEGRIAHWARLRLCLAILPGASMLQYVPRQVPVGAVIARGQEAVPEGHTLDELPDLEEQIQADAEWVAGLPEPPQEDLSILTVRLQEAGSYKGGNATRPSHARLKKAAASAKEVVAKVQAFFPEATPVTAGFLRWFDQYAASFGGVQPPYTLDEYQETGTTEFVSTLRPLLACALNETALHRATGFSKRAFKNALSGSITLETPLVSDPAAPFPTLLPNGDLFPRTQITHQGTVIVHQNADRGDYPDDCMNDTLKLGLDFPVRVAAISRPVSDKETLRKLNDIFKSLTYAIQQASEGTESNTELEDAWDTAHELYDEMLRSRSVRMPTTILMNVGAATREQLELRMGLLDDLINPTGTKATRPAGKQTELWAAMLPGARTPEFVRQYERQLLPDGVAALGLTHGDELGDGYGRIWGTRADRPGAARLVYRMITLGIEMRPGVAHGGSVTMNLGDQGAGKSMDLKALGKDILNQGGRMCGFDRTIDKELDAFIAAVDAKSTVVRFADPNGRIIDPFRVNASHLPQQGATDAIGRPREQALAEAETQTLTYLATMLNMTVDSTTYKILQRAVATVLDDDFPMEPSMPALLTLIMHWAGAADPEAQIRKPNGEPHPLFAAQSPIYQETSQKLLLDLDNLKRRRDVGPQLFGQGPIVDLTNRSLIFSAPDMQLESPSDKAYLYLATTYMLRHLSATPTINGIWLPEAHFYEKIPQGKELIDQVNRQSRRRRAVVLIDTHRSLDVNSTLIDQYTLGRTKNESACRGGLELMGIHHPAPSLIDTIRQFDPMQGHKFYRDRKDRYGIVSVLKMHDQTAYQAAETNYGPDGGRRDMEEAYQ